MNPTPNRFTITLLSLLALSAASCTRPIGPYAPQSEAARDSIKAQRLTQEAGKETDPAKAETLLREALTADIFHGPAHNNLGVIYLKRGELYLAAQEFAWAQKTLPGHPDPRTNLALTLEKAGRTEEALTAYASALEVYKDHLPTVQAMTRLKIKSGRTDDSTKAALEDIAYRGETEQWRTWARSLLSTKLPRRQCDHRILSSGLSIFQSNASPPLTRSTPSLTCPRQPQHH